MPCKTQRKSTRSHEEQLRLFEHAQNLLVALDRRNLGSNARERTEERARQVAVGAIAPHVNIAQNAIEVGQMLADGRLEPGQRGDASLRDQQGAEDGERDEQTDAAVMQLPELLGELPFDGRLEHGASRAAAVSDVNGRRRVMKKRARLFSESSAPSTDEPIVSSAKIPILSGSDRFC